MNNFMDALLNKVAALTERTNLVADAAEKRVLDGVNARPLAGAGCGRATAAITAAFAGTGVGTTNTPAPPTAANYRSLHGPFSLRNEASLSVSTP